MVVEQEVKNAPIEEPEVKPEVTPEVKPEQAVFPKELAEAGFKSYDEVLELKNQKIHPLAEKINELYKNEAPTDQIRKFIDLQFTDLSAMSPVDKIRKMMQMQRPDLDDFDLEVALEEKYGRKPTIEDYDGDEKSEEKLAEALKRYQSRLKFSAGEADEFLRKQKLEIDTQFEKQKNQNEERRATLSDAYKNVSRELIKTMDNIKIGFEDEQAGKFELDYNLRLSDTEKEQLADAVKEFALSSNVDLSTREGLQMANQFAENYLIWANPQRRDEMIKAVVQDVHTSLDQHYKELYAAK